MSHVTCRLALILVAVCAGGCLTDSGPDESAKATWSIDNRTAIPFQAVFDGRTLGSVAAEGVTTFTVDSGQHSTNLRWGDRSFFERSTEFIEGQVASEIIEDASLPARALQYGVLAQGVNTSVSPWEPVNPATRFPSCSDVYYFMRWEFVRDGDVIEVTWAAPNGWTDVDVITVDGARASMASYMFVHACTRGAWTASVTINNVPMQTKTFEVY